MTFESVDANEDPIYHTNVLCSHLRDHVILCEDAIRPQALLKDKIYPQLKNKSQINISQEEVSNYCGNVIMLQNDKDEQVLVMSERARQSFTKKNMGELEKSYTNIVSSDLTTIETIGGGSARCMIAELF